MSNAVIFARPDYDYYQYHDMYRIIELSGYPLIKFSEIDPQSDNTYIMTIVNGENQGGWQNVKARIVLWDLEWRLTGEYPRISGVSEVWASDGWYAEQLRLRDINARFVPLGSHRDLNPTPDARPEKVYDYAAMMYWTPRREAIRVGLLSRGVTIAPNAWDDEPNKPPMARHDILLRSRAMLHIHQNEGVRTIAPQRWVMAAAYRLPIVSEEVTNPIWCGYYPPYELLNECAVNLMVNTTANAVTIRRLADELHQQMCVEQPFRKGVEAAL